ncbi:MAG: IS3 family transposase, partial [Polyangiaceae bacterium]
MEAERATCSIAVACRALMSRAPGSTRGAAAPESKRAVEDRRLGVLVREAHERSRRTYGSPRVHADLAAGGERVSRKRVVRLMQEHELRARVRRRYKNTTDSAHDQPVASNLLDRRFEADSANERWVGDTTELRVGQGCRLFLAAIVDLYSRFVVGWALSAVNDRHLVFRALEAALRHRRPRAGLLHHSDQGSPYASEDYQKILAARGVTWREGCAKGVRQARGERAGYVTPNMRSFLVSRWTRGPIWRDRLRNHRERRDRG